MSLVAYSEVGWREAHALRDEACARFAKGINFRVRRNYARHAAGLEAGVGVGMYAGDDRFLKSGASDVRTVKTTAIRVAPQAILMPSTSI